VTPYRTGRSLPQRREERVLVATRYYPPSRWIFQLRTWGPVLIALGCIALGCLLLFAGPLGGFALFFVAGIVLVGSGIAVRYRGRRLRALAAANDHGLALLNAGKLDAAAQEFDRTIDRARAFPGNHSVFVMNRALVSLKRGELDEAAAMLRMVAEMGMMRPPAFHEQRTLLFKNLAMVEALCGELGSAERWLSRARQIVPARKRPMLVDVEALIEARRGNFDAAAAKVRDAWQEAEMVLSAHGMRVLALIHAFVLEAAHPDGSQAGEVERLVAMARTLQPSSYGYMAAQWDALAQFLLRRDLSVIDPPTPLL
jgi:hypothetical protein